MDQGRDRHAERRSGKPYAAGASDAVIAFIGKRASAKDVGTLTLFFKEMVSQFFPDPCQGDDLAFRELLIKVVNEILLRLRDGHVDGADLETIGFVLRRVWFVAQAYKAEHDQRPIGEWVQKLVGYAKEAGVPVPA